MNNETCNCKNIAIQKVLFETRYDVSKREQMANQVANSILSIMRQACICEQPEWIESDGGHSMYRNSLNY
jgi:hypothetical protein